MPRRRLRLVCLSDEEEEEEDRSARQQGNGVQSQLPTVTSQAVTSSPTPPNSISVSEVPEPVTISDDELISISDDLNPSSVAPPPHRPPRSPSSGGDICSSISDYLCRMGLRLKREWLESCISGLGISVPRFSSLDLCTKAKLCFEHFLFSDMNNCGGGVLPQDVASKHLVELPGPFVLQVDEAVNISCPLRDRYQEAPAGSKRCLKLSMTDGVQQVFGMEYRPIKDLKVLAPAGFKVVISNVQVRRGLLLLVPEVVEVLGGRVEKLDDARKRLVDEVHKPPRGRRTRDGVIPSLAARATHAAWPSNSSSIDNNGLSSLSESAIPLRAFGQGTPFTASGTNNHQRTTDGPSTSCRVRDSVHHAFQNVVSSVDRMHIDSLPPSMGRIVFASHSNSQPDDNIDMVTSRIPSERSTGVSSVYGNGETTVCNEESIAVSHVEEMHLDPVPTRNNTITESLQTDAPENVQIVEMGVDVEDSLVPSGDMEIPFTYLARLSAKWAATRVNSPSIQGTIKCFLTGVKRFQYKGRAKYELECYVDDGSLISEIFIDHKIVEEQIGHPPEEVSAALLSSDARKISCIKETLKKFQTYLLNFEGMMVVEMNKTSPYPVAREMFQGCCASLTQLLLRRLSKSFRHQTPPPAPSDPIDISP